MAADAVAGATPPKAEIAGAMAAREKLGSRLGFLLLSAGCAIGIGNVWMFPWRCGQGGGAWFLLAYLLFLVILGVPVMSMEFAMGRASRHSPVGIYQALTPSKRMWFWHGWAQWIGNGLLMSFYTTVAGWMFLYFLKTAGGVFAGKDAGSISSSFGAMLSDPWQQLFAMELVVAAGFSICMVGLRGGLERVTKWMMLALLAIMAVLAIHAVTLIGAKEGLAFYLMPDSSKIASWSDLRSVLVGAMNQAFFTLSLGIGALAIFGSYIGKERSLLGEAATVAALDTVVAITAGLMIFPACFAYGAGEQDAATGGPALIFITLPNVFNNMPLGRVWGSLFFLFMTFAAFSTVLAVFENLMACLMEKTGWGRDKAGLVNMAVVFLLSIPCALGPNLLSSFHPFGADSGVLDLEDFMVSNLLLPGGSLIFALYCCHRFGWGWNAFVAEANEGRGMKLVSWMRPWLAWGIPAVVLFILVAGLVDKFS